MEYDTIAAIATAPGRGGIGVVRVSGPAVLTIASSVVKKKLSPRLATYGPFYEIDGRVIDEGIALYFKAPHSFTGEDILELQGHGGPVILEQLLKCCLNLGARLAKPGEFSERAFLNDKLDLAQAEAIADLINASSEQAAKSALNSLRGEFSNKIHELLEELTYLRVFVESAIDFPEEEIDFIADSDVKERLGKLLKKIMEITKAAKQGVLLQQGISVVIAGKPNAGKSSLLNCLAGEERAIVTDIAGTTRDVLRENIQIDGMPLHVIDTAGLRESTDIIEQQGITRAIDTIKKADLLLFVKAIDDQDTENLLPKDIEQALKTIPTITIFNKMDLVNDKLTLEKDAILISAKNNQNIEQLKEKIKAKVGLTTTNEDQFIARRRHLEALKTTEYYLSEGLKQLNQHQAGELLAEDLRLAQRSLAEITGEFSSDDLLGKIFSEFCIGK